MRLVIQRVTKASVTVSDEVIGAIETGLLVLLGVHNDDTEDDIAWLCNKLIQMRIFSDDDDKMNRSVLDVSGAILVISQFTLFASTKKGNRPSYMQSAAPEKANMLYEKFVNRLRSNDNITVETGAFGADMKVRLLNDGPVTIIIDSQNKE